jgi:DNA-binding NarL/FixJ family response regulator
MTVAEPELERFESKFMKFDSLMQFRVKRILLVSSLYDSFVLEEDGQLTDLIYSEYLELNLTITPHVKRATNAEEALQILKSQKIDLVIIFKRVADIDVVSFGRAVKQAMPDMPVVLLAYSKQDLDITSAPGFEEVIDWVFMWTGDIRLFLSIVKLVEDRLNVDHDTALVGVRVIVLVEDSVRYYSSFLPLLYTEILQQTQELMAEGLNLTDKLLRMRARPKILLARNYEEAWELLDKYRKYLLGLISDFRFPKDGRTCDDAGLQLMQAIREVVVDLPVVMQSSDKANEEIARRHNAGFVWKQSPTLNQDLHRFVMEYFGFGDFVFKLPDGTPVAVAKDFVSMEKCLAEVDERSLIYHGSRNHFSNWLMARTEFDLAARLRPRKVSEFKDAAALRKYLVDTFRNFRHEKQRGVISDFSRRQFDLQSDFVRIGGGSLGGKGRGLAFINALLSKYKIYNRFEGIWIGVPLSVIIGTDVFDAFMEVNKLLASALADQPDEEIAELFLKAKLPRAIVNDLQAFIDVVKYPLAVRSSSMIEDSHLQPFAGVYDTHMLPNNHPSKKVRLQQLEAAIKIIYASTYFKRAKHYHESVGNRVEDDKMAVIIQRAVGSCYGNYFYPSFAGVALSYNYYSIDGIKPEDGVMYVALGLGKTIVEGMDCLRLCPSYPEKLPQFSTVEDMLNNSQKEFYAIDLSDPKIFPEPGGEKGLVKLPASQAEKDGTLYPLCSTYSPDNDRIYTGSSRKGIRIITFAPILKSGTFPLTDIVKYLLRLGSRGLNCPVEMEFAVNLNPPSGKPKEFAFLQIRPMLKDMQFETVSLDDVPGAQIVGRSEKALGNMRDDSIRDIIVVSPETFDRSKTVEIAEQIGKFNETFRRNGRSYMLIGPGRWGTRERWLGIPVAWNQISKARVIVEAAYGDFCPDPSFGTHFFHNLTTFRVGYLTVNPAAKNGFIDWDWLLSQPVVQQSEYLKHITLPQPIEVRIDGRTGKGVILRK